MSLENTQLHRRHSPEPELVPILDALTSIIFFLMYTTTFLELTSLSLPPSSVNVVTSTNDTKTIPVSPKLFVEVEDQQVHLILKWTGNKPGVLKKQVSRGDPVKYSKELEEESAIFMEKFKSKFPEEKSVQLGLLQNATYQELITVMDGVRKVIQDIVLISPDDVVSNQRESNGS